MIQMLNVKIPLDPTAANVKRDFQEMAKRARVSVDYYPSAILYKSRAAFFRNKKRSTSSNFACLFMYHLFHSLNDR